MPSVKSLQQRIRTSLKNLESLSYNLTDKMKLEEVLTLTTQLEQRVRSLVPTESGLLLRPLSTSSIIARKIRLRYKKTTQWRRAQAYSSLPKGCKRGRPKLLGSAGRRYGMHIPIHNIQYIPSLYRTWTCVCTLSAGFCWFVCWLLRWGLVLMAYLWFRFLIPCYVRSPVWCDRLQLHTGGSTGSKGHQ